MGIAAAAIVVAGSFRSLRKHHDSAQKRSISRLLESSRQHEDAGDFNQALIDLDAALDLAQQANPSGTSRLTEHQKKRRVLAQREVEATLEKLRGHDPSTFPLGAWLNLIARLPRDADLAPLVDPINKQFGAALGEASDFQLKSAHRLFESGQVIESYKLCDRIAGLIKHAEPQIRSSLRSETEKLVIRIVTEHGLTVPSPQGTFVFGSRTSYSSVLMPIFIEAVEGKGYLPYRESPAWRDAWSHAPYQLRLEVTERQEGSYLSTQNRLTRIEAKLSLTSGSLALWQISPSARSSVPLPELSTYVSSRVAAIQTRSEEIEKMLYANAKGQIEDRIKRNLVNMPACRRDAPP